MSMKLPSPVLARLQIMFDAGASLEEAAKAMDIEVSGDGGPSRAMWLPLEKLAAMTEELQSQVDALLDMKAVRERPEFAGAVDLIVQQSRAMRAQIEAVEKAAKEPDEAPVQKTRPVPTSPPRRAPSRPSKPSKPSTTAVSSAPSQPSVAARTGGSGSKPSPAESENTTPTVEIEEVPETAAAEPAPSVAPPPAPEVNGHRHNGAEASLQDKIAAAVSQINVIASENDHDENELKAER